MSISGFTRTTSGFAAQEAAFQRWCVSPAEAEAVKRFLNSNDRHVPATIQPFSENDELLQALLEAEAEEAAENDQMYREHMADQRVKSKRRIDDC